MVMPTHFASGEIYFLSSWLLGISREELWSCFRIFKALYPRLRLILVTWTKYYYPSNVLFPDSIMWGSGDELWMDIGQYVAAYFLCFWRWVSYSAILRALWTEIIPGRLCGTIKGAEYQTYIDHMQSQFPAFYPTFRAQPRLSDGFKKGKWLQFVQLFYWARSVHWVHCQCLSHSVVCLCIYDYDHPM